MTHPSYLGFQLDWPVFCKVPFFADGKDWSRGELFNWRERNIPEDRVAVLYNVQNIYHNKDLEKESKAGDRLVEMSIDQLDTLVNLLNTEVKSRTSSTAEFNSKKCKKSKLEDKQRGLVRSFLRNNRWVEERFYEIRDNILE